MRGKLISVRRNFSLLIGILALFVYATLGVLWGGLAEAAGAEKDVTVKIANGVLRGARHNGAMSFKGVPYGANTAGANRFKAPQPVENWTGIRDATTYGDISPQIISSPNSMEAMLFGWYAQSEPVRMSENCLVLNVFTPDLNDNADRPVLFYIHGGGYVNGGGGSIGIDGRNLARYGDVVVVTINHRLNIFGYTNLSHTGNKDYADAANAGNLDIVAALRWVRDSIKVFGGNPDNVTLFGQSGGGSKIMTLIGMPEAKGLFHKAISMSGAAGLNIDDAKDVEPYADAILKELNVTAANLDDLQKFSVDELFAARTRAVKASGMDGARPVIDDKHIVTRALSPEGLKMQADIPMLLGYTLTEATLFFLNDMCNFTITEQQMRERMKKGFNIDDAKVTRIMAAYRQGSPDMTPFEIFAAVASDVQFRLPLENAARVKSETPNQAPVFLYQFAWAIPHMNGVLGAPHTVDIPFAFGNIDSAGSMIGSGDRAPETALNMMEAFVNFAGTGNPNNKRMPAWAPYDAANQTVMIVNSESSAAANWRAAVNKEIADLRIDPFNRAALYRYSD